VGYVACVGEMRNAFSILVGKYEGKKLLRKLGSRLVDTKTNLKVIGYGDMD